MHLSIFGLNFAISISNVTLKTRSRSPKLNQLFAMSIYRFMQIRAKSADQV